MDKVKVQEIIDSGKHPKCSCKNTKCEQHGHCFECVMVHRHYGNHFPECLQFIISGKISELAKTAEMSIKEKK